MKNVITVDVNNPFYYRLSNIEGRDCIQINYLNHSEEGICEIFYRDCYQEELPIQNGCVELPKRSYSDGCLTHIRYKNGKKTSFLHIVGDGSRYENIVLRKKGECIAVIDGQQVKKKEPDSWEIIAKTISKTLRANDKACCDALEGLRKDMIQQLKRVGMQIDEEATVTEIANQLKKLENKAKRSGDLETVAIKIKEYVLIGED